MRLEERRPFHYTTGSLGEAALQSIGCAQWHSEEDAHKVGVNRGEAVRKLSSCHTLVSVFAPTAQPGTNNGGVGSRQHLALPMGARLHCIWLGRWGTDMVFRAMGVA